MNPNLALLILAWQVACLFHENETDKLLPGSASATDLRAKRPQSEATSERSDLRA